MYKKMFNLSNVFIYNFIPSICNACVVPLDTEPVYQYLYGVFALL